MILFIYNMSNVLSKEIGCVFSEIRTDKTIRYNNYKNIRKRRNLNKVFKTNKKRKRII